MNDTILSNMDNGEQEIRWLIRDKYGNILPSAEETAADIERLKTGEPLDYVIGWKPFLGLHIDLSYRPLIPRAETEYWTERAVHDARERFGGAPVSVLDLCAGSGCIGLSFLGAFPNAHVDFVDIDERCLSQIKINIDKNRLSSSGARLIRSDLWRGLEEVEYDVIVCNPPYVPVSRQLASGVVDFEPPHALFSGDDGLALILRFFHDLKRYLSPRGIAWLEYDDGQQDQVFDIAERFGFICKIEKDQFGRYRFCSLVHA